MVIDLSEFPSVVPLVEESEDACLALGIGVNMHMNESIGLKSDKPNADNRIIPITLLDPLRDQRREHRPQRQVDPASVLLGSQVWSWRCLYPRVGYCRAGNDPAQYKTKNKPSKVLQCVHLSRRLLQLPRTNPLRNGCEAT